MRETGVCLLPIPVSGQAVTPGDLEQFLGSPRLRGLTGGGHCIAGSCSSSGSVLTASLWGSTCVSRAWPEVHSHHGALAGCYAPGMQCLPACKLTDDQLWVCGIRMLRSCRSAWGGWMQKAVAQSGQGELPAAPWGPKPTGSGLRSALWVGGSPTISFLSLGRTSCAVIRRACLDPRIVKNYKIYT